MARIDDVKKNHDEIHPLTKKAYSDLKLDEEVAETLAMICDHLASISASLKAIEKGESNDTV